MVQEKDYVALRWIKRYPIRQQVVVLSFKLLRVLPRSHSARMNAASVCARCAGDADRTT
jgi:hypothetical protein